MPYAAYPSAGTHFLVDLENVHSRWTRIFPELKRGDKISIFVSVPAHTLDILELAATGAMDIPIYFRMCENGRPNAMDFQIMCELGRLSILEPDMRYVLVTDDQCYRSVIKYMSDRQIDVAMFCPGSPDITAVNEIREREPISKTYKRILSEAGITGAQDLAVAAGILAAGMAQPPNRRKADCHNRFLKRYGKAEGELRYSAIRDIVHKIADEGPWPHSQSSTVHSQTAANAPDAAPAQPAGPAPESQALWSPMDPPKPDPMPRGILTPQMIGNAAMLAATLPQVENLGNEIQLIREAAETAAKTIADQAKPKPAVTSDSVNKLLSKAFPLTSGDVAKAIAAIRTAMPAGNKYKALEQALKSAFGSARGAKAYDQLKTLVG